MAQRACCALPPARNRPQAGKPESLRVARGTRKTAPTRTTKKARKAWKQIVRKGREDAAVSMAPERLSAFDVHMFKMSLMNLEFLNQILLRHTRPCNMSVYSSS